MATISNPTAHAITIWLADNGAAYVAPPVVGDIPHYHEQQVYERRVALAKRDAGRRITLAPGESAVVTDAEQLASLTSQQGSLTAAGLAITP